MIDSRLSTATATTAAKATATATAIRRLFGDERAAPAILEFLEDTRVGKMPGQILLAGGPDLEEEELECFSLQVGGRRGDRG